LNRFKVQEHAAVRQATPQKLATTPAKAPQGSVFTQHRPAPRAVSVASARMPVKSGSSFAPKVVSVASAAQKKAPDENWEEF